MLYGNYNHLFAASGGSNSSDLRLYPSNTFAMHLRSNWMGGGGPKEISLFGNIKTISDNYGLLICEGIIENPEKKIPLTEHGAVYFKENQHPNLWIEQCREEFGEHEDEDSYYPLLVFEYILLPAPSKTMDIEWDGSFGMDNFQLLLWIHHQAHVPEKGIIRIVNQFDRAKFERKDDSQTN